VTSGPDFKITILFDLNISEMTRDRASHMHSIEWWYFQQFPNLVFKVTAFSESIISKTYGQSFYRTLNGNIPNPSNGTTFNDIEWHKFPHFKVTTFLKLNRPIGKTKTNLLFHINRKLYLTCRTDVWWPWLTSNRVVRVCQHQLSFLLFAVK